MSKPSIIVIEDETTQLEAIAQWLKEDGWQVTKYASLRNAMAHLQKARTDYDVALVDIIFEREKGRTGMEVLKYVHEHQKRTQVIMITAYARVETAVETLRLGAFDYVIKRPSATEERRIEITAKARQAQSVLVLKEQLRTLACTVAALRVGDTMQGLALMAQSVANGLSCPDCLCWTHTDGELSSTAPNERWTEDVQETIRRTCAQALEGNVLHGGDPVLLSDVAGARNSEAQKLPVGSIMAVPLVVDGEARGAMLVVSPLGTCLTEEDLHFTIVISALGTAEIALFEAAQRMQRLAAERAADAARVEAYRILPPAVAHHIRQPLTVIKGRAEELDEALAGKAEKKSLRKISSAIKSCAERIDVLTGEMMDLARLTQLDLSHTNLNALVRGCVRDAKEAVAAARPSPRISLTLELARKMPFMPLDGRKLAMALDNLIKNAVEAVWAKSQKLKGKRKAAARSSGKVHVTTAVHGYPPNGWAEIVVSDNGVGIPADQMDQVKKPFLSLKPSGSHHGLGLSMATLIVGSHGGSLHVESNEKKGTTVTISLPMAEPEAVAQNESKIDK